MSAPGAFDLGPRRRGRRPSLTPMIDVVFLLLVFFMLAARFGVETELPLGLAASAPGEAWTGPPRLVEVWPGELRLNGVATSPEALPGALAALMQHADDPVLIRPRDGAGVQRLVEVLSLLAEAGHGRLAVVE